jgi:hypothetical protein
VVPQQHARAAAAELGQEREALRYGLYNSADAGASETR